MARIVIIGAGLTGLCLARHLEQAGITEYVILEQEAEPGGLCRSVTQAGFTFDYTGHLIHGPQKHVEQLKALAPNVPLATHTRNAWVHAYGRWIPYPFQQHLEYLPATIAHQCIETFCTRPHIDNPQSFHDWALTTFGSGIARTFFWPFQRKVYAHNLKKVAPGWAARQAPRITVDDLKQGAHTSAVGSNATFLYPAQGGIQTIIEAIARPLHVPIQYRHHVTFVDIERNVVQCTNGTQWPYDALINTGSLRQLLAHINDSPTTAFAPAHSRLRASSVLNINLGLTQTTATDRHWVYTPGTTYPFYRFGMPHMLNATMAPANHKSISIEYAHACNRKIDAAAVIARCQQAVCKLLHLTPKQIVSRVVLPLPDAYAVYDAWHEKNVPTLLARLREKHIWSIGRFGTWTYGSMLDALDQSATTAHHIQAQM